MSDADQVFTNPDLEGEDTHAHVRFYKLLEVAYNCAKNGHYERAKQVANQAVSHYEEVTIDD